MRVVITGICGHLGSAFARWLKINKPEVEVVGIDNFSCGYIENVEPLGFYPSTYPQDPLDVIWPNSVYPIHLGGATRFLNGDGREFVEEVLTGADYVFHFAAYAAEGLSPFIRRYDMMSNLGGTIDIVNACLNLGTVKRIVLASSMAVYGRQEPPFDESLPRMPIDPYGVSKAASEQHLEIAREQHGQEYCIIRPHNIYGPGQSIWQKYRNVLGIWMARRMQGLPLLIYGDGQQMRAFSYIDDILSSLWQAAVAPEAANQIVNLGGSSECSILHAAETLVSLIGGEIHFVEQRHEVERAWCTVQKSIDLLGYRDVTPLHVGLSNMWQWASDAWQRFPERRDSHEVSPTEVRRGMYQFWRE